MTAKEYCEQIQILKNDIDHKTQRLNELRLKAESISSIDYAKDHIQTSCTGDSHAETIALIIELEQEIETEKREIIKAQYELSELMYGTDLKGQQKQIIGLRYFNQYTWNKISNITGLSVRHVIRVHNRAIQYLDSITK